MVAYANVVFGCFNKVGIIRLCYGCLLSRGLCGYDACVLKLLRRLLALVVLWLRVRGGYGGIRVIVLINLWLFWIGCMVLNA
eukprot:gene3102-2084_t